LKLWKLLFYAPLLLVPFPWAWTHDLRRRETLRLWLLTMLVYVACVSFRGTTLGVEHVYVLLPLATVSAAAVWGSLIRDRRLFLCCIAFFLIPDAFNMARFDRRWNSGTRANKTIDRYLPDAGPVFPVVVNDHNLGPDMEIRSHGRVAPVYAWYWGGRFEERLNALIRDRQARYFILVGEGSSPPDSPEAAERAEVFRRTLGKYHVALDLIKRIDAAGDPYTAGKPVALYRTLAR
jgi:hypothetical protein